MKKNTMTVRVIGTVLAIVFVLSAVMAFSAIGASAATVTPVSQHSAAAHNASISVQTRNGDGYDWWYPWNWKAPYHPVI